MKLIAALVMLLALSACSLPVFFRVPIVQGNIVTAGQVAKLDEGMTRKQVAYVLGTPLIKSPFEADRWDYVFYYRNPHAHVRQSKLNLYFVDDKLSDIEGDEEYIAQTKGGDQSKDSQTSYGPAAAAAAQSNMSSPNQPASNKAQQQGNAQPAPGNNQPNSNRTGAGRPTTGPSQSGAGDSLPHRGPPLPGRPD